MADYNFLMESRLSPEQFGVLNHISRLAADQGLNIYLVGGAARDLTYGQQTIRDLDFAVEGSPQRLIRRLGPPRNGRVRRNELRLTTPESATLELEYLRFDSRLEAAEFTFTNGVRGSLARCRDEIYSKPGRSPAVVPATIFEDLKRRDFSVNAMAVSLHPNSRGLLLDPTNGGADVESRELRVMHGRSFSEDPSRLYRLLRLRARLDFKPSERTKQYFDSALENRIWERMAPEQQGAELRAVLQEENPGRVLKIFAEHDLLAGLDRKLARARIPYDGFARIRSIVRAVPGADPYLLNFECLVEKLGSGQRNRLARMILLHKAEARLVFSFEREARKPARLLRSSKAALPSQVYALLLGQPQPLLLYVLAHYPQGKIQNRIKNFLLKYPAIRTRLPRPELEGLGMKHGPKFDKVLEQVFRDQLDGKIKNQPQLLKALRAYAGIKEPPPKPAKPAKAAKAVKTSAKAAAPAVAHPSVPATVPPARPGKPAAPTKPVPTAKPAALPAAAGQAKVASKPAPAAKPVTTAARSQGKPAKPAKAAKRSAGGKKSKKKR